MTCDLQCDLWPSSEKNFNIVPANLNHALRDPSWLCQYSSYVNIHFINVDMQDHYVNMQLIYVSIQDINILQVKI